MSTKRGYFGKYGGCFAPEELSAPLAELEAIYMDIINDTQFNNELNRLLREFVGRPTPVHYAKRLSEQLGGARIYLKREDLLHTGAHKINNTIGQGLLAKHMGKSVLVAETGAGQHGVATATVASLLGMQCIVYMNELDMKRQRLNVLIMQILGATVRTINTNIRNNNDKISEAMHYWSENAHNSYYVSGSAVGPHPYPTMVENFQKIIGVEAKEQILQQTGKLPNELVACVGGGSNSIGLFHNFLENKEIKMTGVEGGGFGNKLGEHAARFIGGKPGIFQGTYSYVLQDDDGNIGETYSVSAGLDYAGIGPRHSHLHDSGRVKYTSIADSDALKAALLLSRLEGIIPALESAHAVAYAIACAPYLPKNYIMLVNLSGRGDKDVNTITKYLEEMRHESEYAG